MRTSTECSSKAHELRGRAEEAPAGPVRDGFIEMAAEWRRLAIAAAREEDSAEARRP